ncbi:MAG: tetratricopeptide repeat protein [Bacteroidota bacterium]
MSKEFDKDSIRRAITTAKHDTTRAKNNCLYCELISDLTPNKALIFGKKGLELAIKTKDLKIIADCYRQVGIVYENLGNNEKALSYLERAIILARKVNNEEIVIKSYITLSAIYYYLEDFTKSLDYSNRVLEYGLRTKNKSYEAYAYLGMSAIYNVNSDYRKALVYLNKVKIIREQNFDSELLIDVYINLGSIYLNINQVDSAMALYEKANIEAKKINNENLLASSYKYLGITYLLKNDLVRADIYLKKALVLFEKLPLKVGKSLVYIHLGMVRFKQNKYNEAIVFLEKSLTLKDPLQYYINAYLYLSSAYDSLGNYRKAMSYLSEYYAHKDSLVNEKEKLDQNKLDIKYQKERREKELLIKQKEIIEQKANLDYVQNRQYIIFGVFLVLSLIFFILFIYYKQVKEKQMMFLEKDIEIKQKTIILEEKKTIETQFESLKNQVNPHFLFNSLNNLIELIDENPAEARDFVENLSAVYRYILQCQDLQTTSLSQELDTAKSYLFLMGKRFENKVIVDIQIPNSYVNYKIVPLSLQILLENCFKHNIISSNMKLYISIYIENDTFIVVKNNFQPKTVREGSTHIGLNNLKSRYTMISDKDIIIEKNEYFIVKIPLIS